MVKGDPPPRSRRKAARKVPVSPQRPLDEARLKLARLSVRRYGLEEVFRRICRIAATALKIERVGIWLHVENQSAIRCVCLLERSRNAFSEGTTLRVADFPTYFDQLAKRRTLSTESAPRDPRTQELAESYLKPMGITSMLDAPIYLGGEICGVLCHESTGDIREWSTGERDFAASVADVVASMIKGAELDKLRKILREIDPDHASVRRRETIATLTEGVAHDFRNLLLAIHFSARELLVKSRKNSAQARIAAEIIQTAQRGDAMISELLEVGKERAARSPEVLDPVKTITSFLPTLRKSLGRRRTIRFHADENIGRVFIDRSQFERILLNLVTNAHDATKGTAPIEVSVTSSRSRKNGRVTLSVRDQGGGIDPALLDRIFDPFFTTKPRGKGTGLGLAIVKQAVEHAGGELRIDNRPPKGATFSVILPRVSAG